MPPLLIRRTIALMKRNTLDTTVFKSRYTRNIFSQNTLLRIPLTLKPVVA